MIGHTRHLKIDAKPEMGNDPSKNWSDFMKTSSEWNFRSIVGKMMVGLVLVAMIGSIDVAPALGKNDKKMGKHDNGRYENRGRGYDQDRGRRDYRPYGYRERVYIPPPVIYAPPPPPGISIFFPPFFFHN
jgi:hypothetical protein